MTRQPAPSVKWFYQGFEVRTGTIYEPGETRIILGKIIAMHPDTAAEMQPLFDPVTVH